MKNKNYIFSLMEKGERISGRGLYEYRDIEIEVNKLSQANGSAKVKIGATEVVVGVKFNVGAPFPDSPDEGVLITSAEHPPLASKDFESGPPTPAAIEFARVVDRTIRESGALDFNKLCITPGEKVWTVFVDIYPINDGGNLFDASAIGALLALSNAIFPKYDKKKDELNHRELSKDKLKLEKLPILCTYGKIGNTTFADPDYQEETVMEDRIHIGIVDNGNICAMQSGGEVGFTDKELKDLVEEAIKKGKDLRKLLKKYI